MPYFWWKTWLDFEGRTWAQPYQSGDPVEAKQQHRDHCLLDWGGGLGDPQVSELEFTNENGHSVSIAQGARRDPGPLPPDYDPRTVLSPVTTQASANPHELPF